MDLPVSGWLCGCCSPTNTLYTISHVGENRALSCGFSFKYLVVPGLLLCWKDRDLGFGRRNVMLMSWEERHELRLLSKLPWLQSYHWLRAVLLPKVYIITNSENASKHQQWFLTTIYVYFLARQTGFLGSLIVFEAFYSWLLLFFDNESPGYSLSECSGGTFPTSIGSFTRVSSWED